MQEKLAGMLARTDIFDDLSAPQLDLVAAICEPVAYDKGEILFREQDSGKELYVIVRGAIEVLMNPAVIILDDDEWEPVILTELHRGQVFGEVALVDQGLRSATIRASVDGTQVLRIPRERLMALCDTYPELGYKIMRNLAADLALKIRHTDLTIRQYQLMLSARQRLSA